MKNIKSKPHQQVILHGEAMIVLGTKLPKTAKEICPSNPEKSYHKIADSETTGNHHVVDVYEGIKMYADQDGTTFMVANKPTRVRCLHENRHSTIELCPGVYEFGIQEEYNHYTAQKQKVRD